MDCPKCALPLQAAHLPMNVTVDYCEKCRGAFYDAGEIQVPLGGGVPRGKTYACPKCRSLMVTAEHFDGKLALEHCESCQGLWFDSGEVVKLKELSGAADVVTPAAAFSPGALDAPSQDETIPTLLSFLYDMAVEIALHSSRRHRHRF